MVGSFRGHAVWFCLVFNGSMLLYVSVDKGCKTEAHLRHLWSASDLQNRKHKIYSKATETTFDSSVNSQFIHTN